MHIILVFYSLFLFFFSGYANAATTDWKNHESNDKKSNVVKTRVLSAGYDKTSDRYLLGLEFQLDKGWKTYWRTPGDGGKGVEINFDGSTNYKFHEIIWPAPERTVFYDAIETYGYYDNPVIPFKVDVKESSKPADLKMKFAYAVCNEICLFFDDEFNIQLSRDEKDEQSASLLKMALSLAPSKEVNDKLEILETKIPKAGVFEVTAKIAGSTDKADLFVEAGADYRFPKPVLIKLGDKTKFIFKYEDLMETGQEKKIPAKLTLTDGFNAIEKDVELTLPSPPKSEVAANLEMKKEPERPLVYYILFALIGGFILNFMPCVLPVLTLKILSIIKHGGSDDISTIRSGFLFSTLGILFSFITLAAFVIGLRQVGVAVGWGFHFQEPGFVVFMIMVLLFFAANQWGFFEIQLPSHLNDKIFSIEGKAGSGLLGQFISGVFATLLATPCTAPFFGSAVGFALERSWQEILIVFIAMGLGLALPYIILMIFPAWMRHLPKPGAWMVKLKYFFSFLIFATAVWLISVLHAQSGIIAVILVSVLSAISILYYSKAPKHKSTFMIISIVLTIFVAGQFKPLKESEVSGFWQNFDELKIAEYVTEGKTVFVDVTADWCLTCKFNEINVINTKEIQELLQRSNVVAMRADYTNRSTHIQQYLAKNGRQGIPFNAVYSPDHPSGKLLPELLTKQDLTDNIK